MPKKKKKRRSRRAKRGIYLSIKTQKIHKFRSMWECVYMKHLDQDPNVKFWDYECLKIPYVSNLKTKKIRNYFPDFYIENNGGKIVVEIKPLRKISLPKNVKKANAALDWCQKNDMKFVILHEGNLKSLGLL